MLHIVPDHRIIVNAWPEQMRQSSPSSKLSVSVTIATLPVRFHTLKSHNYIVMHQQESQKKGIHNNASMHCVV